MKSGIDKAYSTARLLEPTPELDVCLAEKFKKVVDVLTKRLPDKVEDILSLLENDTTSLNEAASMEGELGNMTLKLIKLSHNQNIRL